MWGMGSTAGLRCIGSILLISSGWHRRMVRREFGITGSLTRVCRGERSLKSSAGD
jgi:hypothetical protein